MLKILPIVCVAAAPILWSPALFAQPAPTPSLPLQGWLTTSGRVTLAPQGKADVLPDPLARSLIEETLGRYGIAVDEGRREVLDSLFTEDARLDIIHGYAGPGKVPVSLSGRAAIVANFVSAWKFQADQRRHAITNIVFERLTAHEATVEAYGVVPVVAHGIYLGASVVYTADLKRESDGIWRFSRMLIAIDDYVGTPPK